MNAPLAKEQIALLMSDSLTYRSPVVEGTDGPARRRRFGQMQALPQSFIGLRGQLHRIRSARSLA